MFIDNLKIGRKLNIGFILIVSLTLIIAVYSLFQMQNLQLFTSNLYQHPFKVSNCIREMRANFLLISINIKNLNTTNPEQFSITLKNLDSLEFENSKCFNTVFDKYLGDKDDVLLCQGTYNEYLHIRQEIVFMLKNKEYVVAENLINQDAINKLKILDNQIVKIRDFAMGKAADLYNKANERSHRAILITIILFIFVAICSFILSVIIIGGITTPLKILMNNIVYLKEGNLSKQQEIQSFDEIGELSSTFIALQRDILSKAEIASRIAHGDFNYKAHINNENDQLGLSINLIIDNFGMIIHQAELISNGDFSAKILVSSENDKLGLALNKMVSSLREVVLQAQQISNGDYSGKLEPKSSNDELAISINKMTKSLRSITLLNEQQNWIKSGLNELHQTITSDIELKELGKATITFLCKYLNAQIGALYIRSLEEDIFKLIGSFAYSQRKSLNNRFKLGEGLIGQAALEKEMILLSQTPDDYIYINSGLGNSKPTYIMVAPFIFQDNTLGVIEIGKFQNFGPDEIELIHRALESIAITFNTAINRSQLQLLLLKTQEQTELLRIKQDELLQANVELEEQTKALKRSEEYLQTQQEELRVINEELEENSKSLQSKQEKLILQNEEITKTRLEIEKKANELEKTGKYKSDFLANMSHELRTPLNSLLILSQDLMHNHQGNLDNDQLESAAIIYKSGNDLLNLINEILDLSKIESGKMEISLSEVNLSDIIDNIELLFRKQFKEKGIEFETFIESEVQQNLNTDVKRLDQILKNLISNAYKFTEKGKVKLIISKPQKEWLSLSELKPGEYVEFSVIDTGIGIAPEKHQQVFEAFQQAESGISRKYGGTGLGLSISRELAKLLEGKLFLKSSTEKGSTFSLILPVTCEEALLKMKGNSQTLSSESSINTLEEKEILPVRPAGFPEDDRNIPDSDKPWLLIIEDDPTFAKVLINHCHKKGFYCVATPMGEEGLIFAEKLKLTAIILDINLPGIDGWSVLESLKGNAKTRHIPVHIMTAFDATMEALRKGAFGFLTKPIKVEDLEKAFSEIQQFTDRKVKELLVIEDDENMCQAIKKIIGQEGLHIKMAHSGKEAMELIANNRYDCIVLDLGLPDISGFELLQLLEKNQIKVPPVIIYTGHDLTQEENMQLQQYAGSIIVKGVKSEERLLDETALFLHRIIDNMPEKQKDILSSLYDKDRIFRGKSVLVVDDDMRNVFAISKVLEQNSMVVFKAENGAKALSILEEHTLDIVLMDIMMPIMDGFEAIRKIRRDHKHKNLPIIALTAKAMPEDQVKCIDAGANDYLSKPINLDKLFNMMRVWLY
jgi:CheY-like chemotaxis protein/signal transduction histidine kinase